ncbi:BON domain-containing protein [Endozoicomonadaceae bacterium StTr2]
MARNLKGLALGLAASILLNGCTTILSNVNEGPIEQDKGSRSLGARIDDEIIENVAGVNILKADPAFEQAHVVVVSFNGILLLAGQVPSEKLKTLAEQTAIKTQQARKVYNELEVRGPTSLLTRSSDTYITTKVKTALLTAENSPGERVKVLTENGTVFLMGIVTPKEAQVSTNIVRQVYGVQKVVKVFEYIR